MAGSTPIYGFPYVESSDLVANYPAVSEELAEDIETVIAAIPPGGLTIVEPTSIANSGGTASVSGGQVQFNGVSSVSLNGVFTSTYKYYKILLRINGASVASALRFRLRSSTTDDTGNNYFTAVMGLTTGGAGASLSANGVSGGYLAATSTSSFTGVEMTIFEPNMADVTSMTVMANGNNNAPVVCGWAGGVTHSLQTAYDGITFFPDSGTLIGEIRVYGYKNS